MNHPPPLTTATAAGDDVDAGEVEPEPARCEWDFSLSAVVSPTATREKASDAIGAIDFDPSDRLLATAGIARKIRFYNLTTLAAPAAAPLVTDHSAACASYICAPAKLSSLRWRPDSGGSVIGCGDYDGVVTEYDVEGGMAVFERDEHGGRRVWSVDYSPWAPQVGASGSDDGTVQLWDTRCGGGAATVSAAPGGGAAVCGVEFDPGGGAGIGVGCADRRAYVYDVRAMAAGPVATMEGHRRTVTYVRFVGGGRVVTSGADGTHRLWEEGREVRVYRGHVNGRSFVGLSAWRGGGLLGCGSESNEVFVYDLRWGEPVWVRGFGGGAAAVAVAEEEEGGFVSAVCWRRAAAEGEEEGMLVAGGSNGVLQVFAGKRKTLPLSDE